MKAKSKNLLKDGEILYGDVEMTDEEYRAAQNPKIRTTIFLEADLIRAYKQKALQQGTKYQQLMRETLREALQEDSIEERLQRLEEKVFKKKHA